MRWARFVSATLLILGFAGRGAAGEPAKPPAELFDVDYRSLVSRADLIYRSPASHPVEATPIGNGVMGTMVWTTPEAVWFQLNRVDVFAVNKNHAGEAAAPLGPAAGPIDACGAVAQVSLDVGGPVFQPGKSFLQRLLLYDAEVQIEGDQVRARCFVAADRDLLVLEVDDRRPQPRPLRLSISTWREPMTQRGAHQARCEFRDARDQVVFQQQFVEKDHYCAAALAARVVGEEVRTESSPKTRTLVLPPARGRRTIHIATAADTTVGWVERSEPHRERRKTPVPHTSIERPTPSPVGLAPLDPPYKTPADRALAALAILNATSMESYDAVRSRHTAWWHAFWSRTFVHLESSDGLAAFLQRVRTLHLYYMASSSRGPLPPKWNGSIFTTDGDRRAWGSQYWVWTTEAAYYPLCAADATDLTEPFFRMYAAQLPDCRRAAAQRWGASGAFFPETTPFDGPVVLPEDLAREFPAMSFAFRREKAHNTISSPPRARRGNRRAFARAKNPRRRPSAISCPAAARSKPPSDAPNNDAEKSRRRAQISQRKNDPKKDREKNGQKLLWPVSTFVVAGLPTEPHGPTEGLR